MNTFQNSFWGGDRFLIWFWNRWTRPLKVLFLNKCTKFWKLLSSSWPCNPVKSSFCFSSFLDFDVCNRIVRLFLSFLFHEWYSGQRSENENMFSKNIEFLFPRSLHILFFPLFQPTILEMQSLFFLHLLKPLFPLPFRSMEVLQLNFVQADSAWITDMCRQWDRSCTEKKRDLKSLGTESFSPLQCV